WFLTGTPIRRYADDLYPAMRALFREEMAQELSITSLEGFRQAFCVTQLRRFHPRQPAAWTVIGNKNEDRLRDFIYGNEIAVRRTIHDVAAFMPPLTVRTVTVDFENSDELKEATGEAVYGDESDAVMAKARRLPAATRLTPIPYSIKQPMASTCVISIWRPASAAEMASRR
ncbi:MAG: hypothetical protein EAZ89_14275, partial [Bacteroidetes bacterium]